MHVNAEWKGDRARISTAMTARGFLPCTRLGISSSRVCVENMETSFVRGNIPDIHRPQESQVFDESERAKYETEALDGGIERLRLHD